MPRTSAVATGAILQWPRTSIKNLFALICLPQTSLEQPSPPITNDLHIADYNGECIAAVSKLLTATIDRYGNNTAGIVVDD